MKQPQPNIKTPLKNPINSISVNKLIGIFAAADDDSKKLIKYYGPELVTNGGFDADVNWIKGVGWTISLGKLNDNAAITTFTYQNIAGLVSDRSYRIKIECTDFTSGEVNFYIAGFSVHVTGIGIYVIEGQFTGVDLNLYIYNWSASVLKLDNASINEILYKEVDE